MAAPLDPAVRAALLVHLSNVVYKNRDSEVTLGTMKQLAAVTQIKSNKILPGGTYYFDVFPTLKKKQYVVGCLDRFIHVRVIAVYTLDQMSEVQSEVYRHRAKSVEWKVLEINEPLETELMREIADNPLERAATAEFLRNGEVLTSYKLVPKGATQYVVSRGEPPITLSVLKQILTYPQYQGRP